MELSKNLVGYKLETEAKDFMDHLKVNKEQFLSPKEIKKLEDTAIRLNKSAS